MKRYYLIFILICLFITNCQNISNTNSNISIINLDKKLFIDSIFDYTQNIDYKKDKPAIVYFYSNHVTNCIRQKSIYQNVANYYNYHIKCYSINYEDNIEIANFFNIDKLPAFVFVPLNNKIQVISGDVLTQDNFELVINKIFGI